MGDRYIYYKDCPKCGTKNGIEVYDASSSLIYSAICKCCGYKEDLEYYEFGYRVLLLSKEEYKKLKQKLKERKQK